MTSASATSYLPRKRFLYCLCMLSTVLLSQMSFFISSVLRGKSGINQHELHKDINSYHRIVTS